jgi:molybdopterin-guanine dinucleotide biosynthesis protein A
MKHQKHVKLAKRKGAFEISILGTSCSAIETCVQEVSSRLNHRTVYLDGSHNRDSDHKGIDTYTYNDKGFYQSQFSSNFEKSTRQTQFSSYDICLVNGNHFEAENQIVFLDPKKRGSVERRMTQLTNVLAFVSLEEDWVLFDFLSEFKDVPTIRSNGELSELIAAFCPKPELSGLVLMGGKSSRMGTDKSNLVYHEQSQKTHVKNLLSQALGEDSDVFYSVAPGTHLDLENRIEDEFGGLGPFGAILTAFKKYPNRSFLVLAIDLPLLELSFLKDLISKRNFGKVATAAIGLNKPFPEPLVAIYEPKSYPIMLQYLASGYSCPRKVLINTDVALVKVDDELIENANDKEDYNRLKKRGDRL